MTPRLAVIGAGAKAVAVAAKAEALREVGAEAPEIVAIERADIAANWQSCGGWTDGLHRLGTSPEKDVGFPYRSVLAPGRNAELDAAMLRRSWQSYLVATNQFAEWIDRGRPAPTHRRWASYLRWVATGVALPVLHDEVRRIAVAGGQWIVDTVHSSVTADAVMVTGPGQPERSVLPGNPRVWSIAEFWRRAAAQGRITAERVAVIGGGETAATMLEELFRHRVSAITVISPQVTLFTRGESFFENKLFSDPTDWDTLPASERRDVLARTDRGVFSGQVQQALLADDRIRHLRGRVAHAVDRGDGVRLTLLSTRGGERLDTVHGFDLVVDGRAPPAVVPRRAQPGRPRFDRTSPGRTAHRLASGGVDRPRPRGQCSLPQAVSAQSCRAHPGPGISQPELPGAAVGPDPRCRHRWVRCTDDKENR